MEERQIGKELRALTNMISRNFAREKKRFPYGLTEMHVHILSYLFEHRDQVILQKDIEDEFTIRKSTTSRMLGLIEEKGLIRRESMPHDARQKRIVLTEKATDLDDAMSQRGKQFEKILSNQISQEDRAAFFRVIDQLKENVSRNE